MEGAEQEVIDALHHPLHGFRCIDRIYKNRRIYYKVSKTQDYYTKVIVVFDDDSCNGAGKVLTAYQPDEMTDGEMPEFPYE